jgi:uncharacterized protein (TIGR04255 family)
MLKHLIPVSGKHSINRVTATIHLPQILVKPEDVFEKLKNSRQLTHYQRKNITKLRTISLNENLGGVGSDNKINGVLLEEFDKNGRLKNVLRLDNKSDNKASIVFENRIYDDWDSFKARLIDDLNNIYEVFPFYVEAISLAYVDEFIWASNEEKIKVFEIFNKNSELLNKKFLNSENGTLVLLTQNKKTHVDNEEKTEISFNNRVKRIIINHQFATKLNSIYDFNKLMQDSKFSKYYQEAHDSNKVILKDVLTKEVQDLIKLK